MSWEQKLRDRGKILAEWELEGMKCLVVEASISGYPGSWKNGYVKVPSDHPLHKSDYYCICGDFEVHYGLTFSEIEEDGTWFGFDTNHYDSGTWTIAEMKDEVTKLASQFLELEGGE